MDNTAKIGPGGPEQQKELDYVISSAKSRLLNLERFEKEFTIVSDRLVKIGMALNNEDHPSQMPNDSKGIAEEKSQIDQRRPPALLGRVFDIGERSEEIAISLGRQLKSINTNLDYIEKFI